MGNLKMYKDKVDPEEIIIKLTLILQKLKNKQEKLPDEKELSNPLQH